MHYSTLGYAIPQGDGYLVLIFVLQNISGSGTEQLVQRPGHGLCDQETRLDYEKGEQMVVSKATRLSFSHTHSPVQWVLGDVLPKNETARV